MLLTANASMSSSSSSSSVSSYHSARSNFSPSSSHSVSGEQDAMEEDPLLDILEPAPQSPPRLPEPPTVDEALPFVSRQPPSVPPLSLSFRPRIPDRDEEFRIERERVDAFEREIAALRRSPIRASPSARQPPARQRDEPMPFQSEHVPVREAPPLSGLWRPTSPLFSRGNGRRPASAHHDPYANAVPPNPRMEAASAAVASTSRLLSELSSTTFSAHREALRRSRSRQGTHHRCLPCAARLSLGTEFLDRLLDFEDSLYSHDSSEFGRTSALDHDIQALRPSTTRSSMRQLSPPPSNSFPIDFQRRERDRTMEAHVDRAIRDADFHRQRVADLLAESRVYNPTFDPPSYATSSTFSTLRGALGDSSLWQPARTQAMPSLGRSRAPDEPTTATASVGLAQTGRRSHSPVFLWDEPDPAPFSREFERDFGLSTTSRSRDIDDLLSISAPQYPPSDPAPSWRLAERSRARAAGLSGLRHRARPRSPSPSPPRAPSPWGLFLGASESRRPVGSLQERMPSRQGIAARTPADSDMLSAFDPSSSGLLDDSLFPSIGPQSLTRAPSPVDWSPPNIPSGQPRQSTIDLSAYRDGPFRATLARSMALQRQRGNPPDRPPHTRPPHWSLDEVPDEETPSMGSMFQGRSLHESTSLATIPEDRFSPWSDTYNLTRNPHAAPELMDHAIFAEAPRQTASPTREREAQNPTDRLREMLGRPSGVPMPSRPTLLDRTRPSASSTSMAARPTRATEPEPIGIARLEVFDQRRDMARRLTVERHNDMATRPRLSDMLQPPVTSTRTQSRAREEDPPTILNAAARRMLRARRDAAAEEARARLRGEESGEGRAPPPLNGRFARSRPGYLPPDMILTDIGGGRVRRRNLGDYMVSAPAPVRGPRRADVCYSSTSATKTSICHTRGSCPSRPFSATHVRAAPLQRPCLHFRGGRTGSGSVRATQTSGAQFASTTYVFTRIRELPRLTCSLSRSCYVVPSVRPVPAHPGVFALVPRGMPAGMHTPPSLPSLTTSDASPSNGSRARAPVPCAAGASASRAAPRRPSQARAAPARRSLPHPRARPRPYPTAARAVAPSRPRPLLQRRMRTQPPQPPQTLRQTRAMRLSAPAGRGRGRTARLGGAHGLLSIRPLRPLPRPIE